MHARAAIATNRKRMEATQRSVLSELPEGALPLHPAPLRLRPHSSGGCRLQNPEQSDAAARAEKRVLPVR